MTNKIHALSLFTKSPQPGITKTRLTRKYGGSLTEQEAADLYQAMMLDVATAGLKALEMCRQTAREGHSIDDYDFFISCPRESEIPKLQAVFASEFSDEASINYIVDRGRNFDEHFNDHYRQLFDRGYYSVVCLGGDLPTASPEFIHRAFQWLFYTSANSKKGSILLAPCQAAGVSLVGLTADAPMDFTSVFYNMQGVTALEAITRIAAEKLIPLALMESLFDVDCQEDLAHIISVINAMAYACHFQPDIYVPQRTMSWIQQANLTVCTAPNEDQRGDQDDQD
jgi:uncharacterized protein